MVRRVSTFVRDWILVTALAQAALPGAISIIDASAAGDVACAVSPPHLESHGTSTCKRVHQEDNCPLCQYVSGLLSTQPTPPALPPRDSRVFHVQIVRQELPTWRADGAPSLPRAPPVQA